MKNEEKLPEQRGPAAIYALPALDRIGAITLVSPSPTSSTSTAPERTPANSSDAGSKLEDQLFLTVIILAVRPRRRPWFALR